jgi:hypothetical protein
MAIEIGTLRTDGSDSKVNELAVVIAMSRLRNGLIAFGCAK